MYQDRVKEVSVGRGVLVEPERVSPSPRMQAYEYERAPPGHTVQYDRAPPVQYESAPLVQYERGPAIQTIVYERPPVQYRDDAARQYERAAPLGFAQYYERPYPSVVSYGERERERPSYGERQSISSYHDYSSSGYQPASARYGATSYASGQAGGSYEVESNGGNRGTVQGTNVEIMS